MSHQDRNRKTEQKADSLRNESQPKTGGSGGGELPLLNSAYLGQALQWILARGDWKSVGFRDDCSWTPRVLSAAALLWAWSDEGTLGERFFAARRLVAHRHPQESGERPLATSYQALIKLLVR